MSPGTPPLPGRHSLQRAGGGEDVEEARALLRRAWSIDHVALPVDYIEAVVAAKRSF